MNDRPISFILRDFLNFTLDAEDLFCWFKRKKWFLWATSAVQAAEENGDEEGLI